MNNNNVNKIEEKSKIIEQFLEEFKISVKLNYFQCHKEKTFVKLSPNFPPSRKLN